VVGAPREDSNATGVNGDQANNSAGDSGAAYVFITLYTFSGFFQPVDNPPVVNLVSAGAGIPVRFSLGGDQGPDIFAAGYPASQEVACASGTPTDPLEQTVTAGASSLTYHAGADQYTYLWKTKRAWAGTCRQLNVTLNDGTTHVANFQFR